MRCCPPVVVGVSGSSSLQGWLVRGQTPGVSRLGGRAPWFTFVHCDLEHLLTSTSSNETRTGPPLSQSSRATHVWEGADSSENKPGDTSQVTHQLLGLAGLVQFKQVEVLGLLPPLARGPPQGRGKPMLRFRGEIWR